jgi:hypothetical protein
MHRPAIYFEKRRGHSKIIAFNAGKARRRDEYLFQRRGVFAGTGNLVQHCVRRRPRAEKMKTK